MKFSYALGCAASPGIMLFGLVGVVPISLCSPLLAQQPAALPNQTTIAATAPTDTLEQDPALGVKVSFTAKAQSLESVLGSLQKISTITLTAARDTQASRLLVTARVKELPLATVLGSFSRLYGVRWVKVGATAYEMRNGDVDALHRQLLQVGDPYWYRSWHRLSFNAELQRKQSADLSRAIYDSNPQALLSKTGLSFSNLPDELQEEVRKVVQEQHGEALIRERRLIDGVFSHQLYLHLGKTPANIPTLVPGISVPIGLTWSGLTVRGEDGRFVAQVFDKFILPLNEGPQTRPNDQQ